MPITITPAPPGNTVGPGIKLQWLSDFIGPLPIDTSWRVQLHETSAEGPLVWTEHLPATGTHGELLLMTQTPVAVEPGFRYPTEGEQIWINVQLEEPAGVIDSGTTTATWSATRGVGYQSYVEAQQGTSTGGYTEADRTLATQTNDLVEQLLTLTNLVQAAVTTTVATTSGAVATPISDFFKWIQHALFEERELIAETCEAADVDIGGGNYFSVTLEITQFPEDWKFQTPDSAWGFHDLAVLRFYSGSTMLARHGVHATQHYVSPLPGTVWWGGPIAQAPLQWAGYHIRVDWAPGVCGRLTGDSWPL